MAHRVQYVTVHGHRRAFVRRGSGPVILLLHGLGCDHRTWEPVIDALARDFTVIAPDLLGHGESDKPRADYSVGGCANGMRGLLALLGLDRVTVGGHSLGGRALEIRLCLARQVDDLQGARGPVRSARCVRRHETV